MLKATLFFSFFERTLSSCLDSIPKTMVGLTSRVQKQTTLIAYPNQAICWACEESIAWCAGPLTAETV